MITDARVLRPEFVPRDIVHRDAEVSHLSSALRPLTNGNPAETALPCGPSGAGKTFILDERLVSRQAYPKSWRIIGCISMSCSSAISSYSLYVMLTVSRSDVPETPPMVPSILASTANRPTRTPPRTAS